MRMHFDRFPSRGAARRAPAARAAARPAAVERLEPRRLLSVGTLDPHYGAGGIAAFTYIQGAGGSAVALAATPDGRAYVAGHSADLWGLARLTFDGQLDPTFGNGGVVVTDVDPAVRSEQVHDVVLQPDGKIIVGGVVRAAFALVRYNPDGSLDQSFGNGGIVRNNVVGDQLNGLLLQPDGKVIALGDSDNGNRSRSAAIRFHPDGTVDAGFGDNGIVIHDFSPTSGSVSSDFQEGLVLPDGKLLFAGGVYSGVNRPLLFRYNPDGTLDDTFATGGITTDRTPYHGASSIAAAPGGGGAYYAVHYGPSGAALARWNADGTIDRTFGDDGSGTVPFVSNARYGSDVAVQPDGTVVAAHGVDTGGAGWAFAVFSPAGRILAFDAPRLGGTDSESWGAVALQPDGRALVGSGQATYPSPLSPGPLVARYRTMPDAPPGARLESGMVFVTGSDGDDVVSATRDGATLSVTVNGTAYAFPAAGVSRVESRLMGGDDTITTTDLVPAGVIDLGDGNNTARLGGPALRVVAGTGGDTLEFLARPGAAAAVSDTLVAAGGGDDLLKLTGGDAADAFRVLAGGTAEVSGRLLRHTGVERLSIDGGGEADQFVLDTPDGPAVAVAGGAGDDVLTVLRAPAGRALPFAGDAGRDRLVAPAAANLALTFSGGADADTATVTGSSAADDRFTLAADGRLTTPGGFSLALVPAEGDAVDVETIEVEALGGNDTFDNARTAAGVAAVLRGGDGADQYRTVAGVPLAGSSGVRFEAGGQPGDAAVLADVTTADDGLARYSIGGGAVARDGLSPFRHGGLDRLSFAAGDGSGGSAITVSDAAGLAELTVLGGRGPDTIELLPADPAAGLGADPGATIRFAGRRGADAFRVRPESAAGPTLAVYGGELPPPPTNPPGPARPYDPADPGDRLAFDFDWASGSRLTLGTRGAGRYAFSGRGPVEFADIESVDDLPAPASLATGFRSEPSHALALAVTGDVGASLANTDLVLTDLTRGETVPAARVAAAYDAASEAVVFTFPGYAGGRLPPGDYRALLPAGSVAAAGGEPLKTDLVFHFIAYATVVGRRVFYNNSAHDSAVGGPAGDDAAVDPDKTALRPGQTASPANSTSYSRGINGMMIDVAGLPQDVTLRPSDLLYRSGTGNNPAAWLAAPAPTMTVRRGAGPEGTDRVVLTWADGAIKNKWLQVTVPAGDKTGLAAADVFYFGNLVGDADGSRAVNLGDFGTVRQAFGRTGLSVADGRSDFNRDGTVNLADFGLLRQHFGLSLPPPVSAAAAPAETRATDAAGVAPSATVLPPRKSKTATRSVLLAGET